MNTTIFISYRRKESSLQARAVYERLKHDFPGQVFMDVESIGKFVNFQERLHQQLQGCRVLVALIGPQWHSITDKQGRIRLHQEQDWIRLEIRTALSLGIPVLPVLLDNADMPDPDDLPGDLHPLLAINALPLDMARYFDYGMHDLVKEIQGFLNASPARPALPIEQPKPQTSIKSASRPILPDPAPKKVASVVTVDEIKKTQMAALKKAFSDSSPSSKTGLPWAKAQGDRDEFETPWADFEINGVTQRMRWIKPGSFLMGAPRHTVTLTCGFWLADTVCTQALWREVLGSNPSQFQGSDDLPVEQVSWDDVTGLFLPKLTQLIGAKVDLPTEAEWEYAAKTGADAAVWFNEIASLRQLNFDKSPYGRPIEVKALPANKWGIYQMLGNVWEWCQGGLREYTESPVENPQDIPVDRIDVWPAQRGGAFDADFGYASPSARNSNARDWRVQSFGFRLTLRSEGPVSGGA